MTYALARFVYHERRRMAAEMESDAGKAAAAELVASARRVLEGFPPLQRIVRCDMATPGPLSEANHAQRLAVSIWKLVQLGAVPEALLANAFASAESMR